MVKAISKKQKDYRFISIFVAILNIIGIILLLYFSIPYIFHIRSLNAYSCETCGFILVLGFIPLLIANIMSYCFIAIKKKTLKLLFFIPSLICLILVGHYLITSTTKESEKQKNEPLAGFKCYLNHEVYKYLVYMNADNELTIEKNSENDKLPLSEIDTIDESLMKYYKNYGGFCP